MDGWDFFHFISLNQANVQQKYYSAYGFIWLYFDKVSLNTENVLCSCLSWSDCYHLFIWCILDKSGDKLNNPL